MDNIIQFQKFEPNTKDEIKNAIIENLIENGASQDFSTLVGERMSSFLDILCSFEFYPDLPSNPSHEDYKLLFKQVFEKISMFREELLLERLGAETFYLNNGG